MLARDRGVGADVSVQPGFVIAHNQSDTSDRRMQIFGVDKSAEITVNWSMRFGSVSS